MNHEIIPNSVSTCDLTKGADAYQLQNSETAGTEISE